MRLTDKHDLRTIAYHPELKEITGSPVAAIIIQQLLYWWSRKHGKFIYKTVTEMEQETGMTKHQQSTACKTLEALGFIKIHYRGTHKVRHFEVFVSVVDKAIDGYVKARGPLKKSTPSKSQTSQPKTVQAVSRKPVEISTGKRSSITKSTSEISSETLSHSVEHSKSRETKTRQRETEFKLSQALSKNDLPHGLDPMLWHTWVETRNAKFGTMTPSAERLALKDLSDLVKQGWPALQIVREAISRGTPRLYPPCRPGTEASTLALLAQANKTVSKQPARQHNAHHAHKAHELRQEIQGLSEMIKRDKHQRNIVEFKQQLARAQRQLAALECKAA